MVYKKWFKEIFLFFILFILSISNMSYADDIDTSSDVLNLDILNANILDQEILHSEILEASTSSSNELSINSRAYVVLDRNSNRVLLGKNENIRRKMASTTKIMTGTIIIENCNLSDIVTISKKAASVGGSVLGLKAGDKISVNDLLYGLLLKSGNDCAIALAEYAGGSVSEFANLMNKKSDLLRFKGYSF